MASRIKESTEEVAACTGTHRRMAILAVSAAFGFRPTADEVGFSRRSRLQPQKSGWEPDLHPERN